ncbi:MAG: class I SAM-dependent methyltransferase [Candidatus Methanofastidiosia archaeon]
MNALNELEAETENHREMLNLYWERRRMACVLSVLEGITCGSCHLIDVGSGDGVLLELLESPGSHHVGVDLSFTRLHRAAQHCHALSVQAEATQLPFSDSTFDLVICTEVLEHLSSIEKAVSELARICTGAGHILIGIPCYNAYRFFTGKKRYISPYTHLREFSYLDARGFEPIHTLVDLFREEGFVLNKRKGTCVFSITTYQKHASSLFQCVDRMLSHLPVRGLHLYEVLLFRGMK